MTIIRKSSENMKAIKSQKYGISPDEVEEKSLSSQRFRVLFNFKRIERSRAVSDRLDRYDRKEYTAKRTKLRSDVQIGKKSPCFGEDQKKICIWKILQANSTKHTIFQQKSNLCNKKKTNNRQKGLLLIEK